MSDLPLQQVDHPAHNLPTATEHYSGTQLAGDPPNSNSSVVSYGVERAEAPKLKLGNDLGASLKAIKALRTQHPESWDTVKMWGSYE